MNDFFDEALSLTKEMVAIPSINGTEGERVIAEYIESWLRRLPYFLQHPGQVVIAPLKDDPLGRRNVIALARGTKGSGGQTVILHGHHDTVGIDDFGPLKEFAFQCDALPERIKELAGDPDVLADIQSGNWLFGRGAGDMKSGIAVSMLILKYFTEHLEEFNGNLLFMTNPVEENQHTGIIEALTPLEQLKEAYGLTYKMAVNTDAIPPMYPGDPAKSFFSGASGKILPCFYVMGIPTHAGQCFQGLSASMIVSELIQRMELSLDFVSSCGKEYTIPPTVLKVKDCKDTYDVQTAVSAFVYFNLFLNEIEMDEVFRKLRGVALDAMNAAADFTNRQYKAYCEQTGALEYRPQRFSCQVMEYRELYQRVKAEEPGIDGVIEELTAAAKRENQDLREISLQIVRELATRARLSLPVTILFLAPPYLPRNMIKPEIPEENRLLDSVSEVLAEAARAHNEVYRLVSVNPFPTDCSYLRADDSPESLQMVVDNFPNMKMLYDVPVQQIKRVNIPAFCIAGSCKDAHKWTERLDLDFTFRKLPEILIRLLEKEL